MEGSAVIHFKITRAERGSALSILSDVAIRYTFTTEAKGDTLRIRFGRPSVVSSQCAPHNLGLALLGLFPVDSIINANGEFSDIIDPDQFLNRVNSLAPFKCDPIRLTREQMAVQANVYWLTFVDMWAGSTYVAGVPAVTDDHVPVPIDPDIRIRRHTTVTMSDVIPCVRAGKIVDCVALDQVSTLSAFDLQSAATRYRGEHPGNDAAIPPSDFPTELSIKLRVVTEPTTLVPHDFETTITRTVAPEPGGTRPVIETKTWTATFSYP
jgi:hypothetical protein